MQYYFIFNCHMCLTKQQVIIVLEKKWHADRLAPGHFLKDIDPEMPPHCYVTEFTMSLEPNYIHLH